MNASTINFKSLNIPCLLLVLMLGACEYVANTKPAKPVLPPIAQADKQVLEQCYQALLLMKMMNSEATTRSAIPETREMATRAIADHNAIMERITTIAGKYEIELPLDITAEQLRRWQELVKAKGLSFDKAYAEQINQEHEVIKNLYRQTRKDAVNADVKDLANDIFSLANNHQQESNLLHQTLENRRSRDTPWVNTDSFFTPIKNTVH